MKAIYKKLLLILLLFVTVTAFSVGLFVFNGSAVVKAYDCEVSTTEPVKTVYDLQDTFVVPSAEIEYGGQKYTADKKSVTFPDGKKYVADSVTLTMAGTYTLNYSCETDGKILSGSKTFTVHEKLFSVTGEGATASYSVDVDVSNAGKHDGISVSLPMGGEFVYNKVIDLAGKKKEDKLIQLFTMPSQIGVPEAGNLIVKLTDAYDPDNYVLITTYDNIDKNNKAECYSVYQLANAFNQAPTGVGFSNSTVGSVLYNGLNYKIFRNSYYGYYGYFSFSGYAHNFAKPEATPVIVRHQLYLSMDYGERVIYGSSPAVASDGMIADLDAPQFFATPWEGFTTGEAILSVYSTNLLTGSFNFLITDIYDEALDGADVSDTKAPIINVDLEGNDGVPYAIINKPYEIFSAKAVDDYSPSVKCLSAVYYNYRTNTPVNVNVVDGSFTPNKLGVYTIVYSATDGNGNTTVKEVDVEVKSSSQLKVAYNGLTANAKVGETFSVQPSISGNSGLYTLSVKAVLKSNPEVTYDLVKDGDTFSFIPLYGGKYDLVVMVNDRLEKIEQSKEIEVSALANSYYLTSEPSLPHVFIKGVEYDINGLQAYDLSSGTPVLADAKIEYALDNGEYTSLGNQKLNVTASEKVKIKYVFGTGIFYKEYTVPVTDVDYDGDLIVKNYFYGVNFTGVADEDGTNYTTSVNGASLAFANELLSDNFTFNYTVLVKRFTAQTLELIDSKKPAEKLLLTFTSFGKNQIRLTVNGEYETEFTSDIEKTGISVNYNGKANKLYINGSECAIGNFTGFASHMLRLKLTLDGVAGESTVRIREVNNQYITSDDIDRVPPSHVYVVNKEIASKGDELVINKLIFADVLRREVTFDFSMSDPNGDKCTTTDGIRLNAIKNISREYTVVLSEYGDYNITGKYSDGRNTKRFSITITVIDDGAPELKITEQIQTAQLNTEITFDKYSVTDNIDTDVEVKVYVINTLGKMELLPNKKYTATAKGMYSVMFVATDSSGNTAIESYTFDVK